MNLFLLLLIHLCNFLLQDLVTLKAASSKLVREPLLHKRTRFIVLCEKHLSTKKVRISPIWE
jgi:hypothetical protein